MKNYSIAKLFFFLILIFAGFNNSYSQFEQKLTLNFSLGYIRPVGLEDYIYYDYESLGSEWVRVVPYVMSNFDPGVAFNSGIQINFNRRFSIAGNVGFFNLWAWYYESKYTIVGATTEKYSENYLHWEITGDEVGLTSDDVLLSGENTYNLINFNLGITPKFYLSPGKNINPYAFFGLTFNYTSLNFQDDEAEAYNNNYPDYSPGWNPLSNMFEKSFGPGVYPGLGIDLKLSENLGIFLQGGYSIIFLNSSKMEEAGLEPENFKTFNLEAGIKLSFLKSKNL